MCVQSLSLWAEATRYRLQVRRQPREPESAVDEQPIQPPPASDPTRAHPELVGAGDRL